MMPVMDSLIGQKFNMLTVVSRFNYQRYGRNVAALVCRCECGRTKHFIASKVVHGRTKSCGCLLGVRRCPAGKRMSRTPEYGIWNSMLSRCNRANSFSYPRYGGRGIRVCDRWSGRNGFGFFLDDMGPRPSGNHSIDRIDNDGPYSPENCRWATRKQQANNQNRTATSKKPHWKVEYLGETDTVSGWSRRLGISRRSIAYYLTKGMSMDWVVSRHVTKSSAELPPAVPGTGTSTTR